MSHYDDVVAKILDSEPGVIDDFLFEAGLGDDPVEWSKVKEQVEFDLMPKRTLHDLVGTNVFPAEGRKGEKWGKGVAPMKPRIRKHVRGYLYKRATQLINRSNALPSNSPRRLSDDLLDMLRSYADLSLNDVSERAANVIWSGLECSMRDGRESASLLAERRDAFSALKVAVTETVQALRLTHDEPPDDSNHKHPTNGAVREH